MSSTRPSFFRRTSSDQSKRSASGAGAGGDKGGGDKKGGGSRDHKDRSKSKDKDKKKKKKKQGEEEQDEYQLAEEEEQARRRNSISNMYFTGNLSTNVQGDVYDGAGRVVGQLTEGNLVVSFGRRIGYYDNRTHSIQPIAEEDVYPANEAEAQARDEYGNPKWV